MGSLVLCAVGDIEVNRDDPASAFAPAQPVFDGADIVFGNCESNYSEISSRNPATRGEVRAHPRNVDGLAAAGFDVMSFANNHHLDSGYEAFFDTIGHLTRAGIAVSGAGKDLAEARRPVILERAGIRVAFISYSTIMFPGYEAGPNKAGAARLEVLTHYRMSEIEQPGCEARVATTASRAALTQLREDIENARCEADVVVISIHWGLHFTPAAIADYETEIGRAAIDFGADLILGHHQHILKGIQVYKGKAIFHGLGNFVLDVPSSQLANPGVQEMQHNNPSYAVARYADYPSYPFHPDARRTAIARVLIEDGKVIRVGFLPCLIDRTGTPQVVKHGTPEFDDVVTYMIEISEKAGFPTEFDFISDEVFVRTE